jgi:hypothetical protein
VAGGPQNVILGDLNHDAKTDIVVANGQGRSLMALLGDGRGGFRTAPGSPLGLSFGPSELALEDINGDGTLDLATTDHDSYGITVLFGDGKGGFTPAPGSPFATKKGTRPHTHGLALRDVNADGRFDIIVVNNADNDVSVMLGDGKGDFRRAPGSPFAVGPSPYPMAVGDVNEDTRLDVVTPNTSPGNRTVTALLGDGRGGFRPASPYRIAGQPYYVALGDLDGDRHLDLVASHNNDDSATILLGDGNGGFRPAPGSPFNLGHRAWAVELVDLNSDKRTDLIAATDDGVRVWLGSGRGGFESAPGSPFAAGKGVWRFVVGDINGDGKPDVVASGVESDSVSMLLGR